MEVGSGTVLLVPEQAVLPPPVLPGALGDVSEVPLPPPIRPVQDPLRLLLTLTAKSTTEVLVPELKVSKLAMSTFADVRPTVNVRLCESVELLRGVLHVPPVLPLLPAGQYWITYPK